MLRSLRWSLWIFVIVVSTLLNGCGGGNDGSDAPTILASIQEPNAPQSTGDMATDGINWFNFRRQQMGLSTLIAQGQIDVAAQGHSLYQQLNNIITHEQTIGKPGFTGVSLADRLAAADYQFTNASYAYGEVIANTNNLSGMRAAEDLIAAIYHRFVVFEPMFKEVGAGATTISNSNTYFTTDFAANGLGSGVGVGNIATYPYANQQQVPRNFFSDNESPDPVSDRNEVGYPISIHADITARITVQSFSIKARGGTALPVQRLVRATDSHTPFSVAAIIPLNVLASGTVYDVQFIGTVDNIAVSRAWSFTTQ